MTQTRKHIVCIDHSGTYHCVLRCVCGFWLCGWDNCLRKSLATANPWVERRVAELTDVFACSILSYAVIINQLKRCETVDPVIRNVAKFAL